MEKLRSKKIPNRDLINKFGERLKNGEKIEDIYGELVNKEYYRRTISGREAWLSYALRNLAFACLENKVEFFEKKGLDLLKYVTSYAIEELLIYPLIHYLRDYLDKSPDESLTIDGHTFTKEGLLTTTVNGFINSELRRKYHMKFEEDYDVSDPSCKEKYPIFYIGEANEVFAWHMMSEFFTYVTFCLGELFQEADLPKEYLKFSGETTVNFINYMIKRVENFEIAQQIDSRNELHYYSLAEMIEIYNKSNHEMQMEKLKEFLMKAASYDERLRKGEKVTDIYGAEQSFVSMIFKLLDNYSEIFPLAYAYAKKMLEEGKTEIPKSGVLEVDAAILHMKQR